MPIDPNIALSYQAPQIESPLNNFAKFATIQNSLNQNALSQYQLVQAQRDNAEKDALRAKIAEYAAQPGGLNINDPAQVAGIAAASPVQGSAFVKSLSTTQSDQATAEMNKAKVKNFAAETLDKTLQNFNSINSPVAAAAAGPDGVIAYTQAMYAHPILGPMAAQTKPLGQAITDNVAAFQNDPKLWVAAHANLKGDQILATQEATRQNINLGATNLGQSVDKFGRVIPGSQTSTPTTLSPDAAANANARVFGAQASQNRGAANYVVDLAKGAATGLDVSGLPNYPMANPPYVNAGGAPNTMAVPSAAAPNTMAIPAAVVPPLPNTAAGTTASVDPRATFTPQEVAAIQADAAKNAGAFGPAAVAGTLGTSLNGDPAIPMRTAANKGLKGAAFLAAIPQGDAATVQAIAHYQQKLPDTSSPAGQATKNAVYAYDPTYDQTLFGAKAGVEKSVASGAMGNTIKSLNVADNHLDTVSQLGVQLNNDPNQFINKVGNAVAAWSGDPAPTTFQGVVRGVVSEIVKASVGNAGALGDRNAIEKAFSDVNSPAQIADMVTHYRKLMTDQATGIYDQYKRAGGSKDATGVLGPRFAAAVAPTTSAASGTVDTSTPLLK